MSLLHRRRRQQVRERDGDLCWICGAVVHEGLPSDSPARATIDHVRERALGGSNDLSNLRLAHFVCNANRSNSHTTRRRSVWRTPGLQRLLRAVDAMFCWEVGA